MVVSDEEEDRISTSGDDDGHGEGNFDELIFLETSSVVDSAGSIFLFPERNEDYSTWLNHEGIKPGESRNLSTGQNVFD